MDKTRSFTIHPGSDLERERLFVTLTVLNQSTIEVQQSNRGVGTSIVQSFKEQSDGSITVAMSELAIVTGRDIVAAFNEWILGQGDRPDWVPEDVEREELTTLLLP